MKTSPATRSVLLTPPGSGAIAVVRVVGDRADEIISQAFTPIGNDPPPGQAGRLCYGTLNRGEEVIDDVLVCRIAGQPELVWEICAHGGVRVVERIIEVLSALGACLDTAAGSRADGGPPRSAIEQDALSALARVKTAAGLQFLAWQRAHLEETQEALAKRWATDPDGARRELRQMMARARQARVLLDGADVAIIGPPNAGKSTLLNRLVGRAAAVVSSAPGTTRDWVDAEIEVQGVPIRLIDTAGRRAIGSSLEREAIRRGVAAASEVDLSLIVLDATCVRDQHGIARFVLAIPPERAIVVLNKMDLMPEAAKTPTADLPQSAVATLVSISAKTGWGVDTLGDAMLGALGVDGNLFGLPSLFCDRQMAMAQRCLAEADPHSGDRAGMIRRLLIGA